MSIPPTEPRPGHKRIHLTIDIEDEGHINNHAANALLDLCRSLRHDRLDADLYLDIPGQGTLSATTRPD